jgi:hypothetical protein
MASLADYISMGTGKMTGLAAEFAANPEVAMASRPAGMSLHESMRLAREAGLSSRQIGGAFGPMAESLGMGKLTPEQLKKTWLEQAMASTGKTQEEIAKKGAKWWDKMYGLSTPEAKEILANQGRTDAGPLLLGAKRAGAGRRVALGEKMFQSLGAAPLGHEIQADITHRLMRQYPEKLIEKNLLYEALDDLIHLNMKQNSVAASKVGEEILERGGVLRVGELADITIPSFKQLDILAEYGGAGRTGIYGGLRDQYKSLIGAAQALEAGDIPTDAAMSRIEDLRSTLSRATARSITGPTGMVSQKLPGSARLAAVSADQLGLSLPPRTVGITEKYASRMFEDLSKLYEPSAIAPMRARFGEGKAIAGFMGKGISFGEASPVMFQKIAGEDAIIAMNQKAYQVRAALRSGSEYWNSPIRMSSLGTMTGAVDGDVISAVMAGPQVEQRLGLHIAAGEETARIMEQHTIRSQALKAKAVESGALSVYDAIAAGVVPEKPGRQILGSIDTARAALANTGKKLSVQAMSDATTLLDWIENASMNTKTARGLEAISEGGALDLAQSLKEGITYREADRIAATARSALEMRIAGSSAMKEGMQTAMENLATGEITQRTIPALDIKGASENIVTALKAQDASNLGSVSAGRQREILQGARPATTSREVRQVLGGEGALGSPFSAFFSKSGQFKASMSKRAMSIANQIGAAGRSILPHAKPLAIGFGATLALSAALSDPPRSLEPGRAAPPQADMRRSTEHVSPDNIHPSSSISGAPTMRTLEGSANTSRITSGSKITVSGRSSGPVNYPGISEQVSQVLDGNTGVNSTISDQKSSMSAQRIAKLMRKE